MKEYILTEEDRDEILRLMRSRSYSAVKNHLTQLKEIKKESVKKYFCSVHKGEGDPKCKECVKNLKKLAKDNNTIVIGDFK